MESHTHAYAHSLFNEELLDKLKSMQKSRDNLRFFASAHVQGDDRIKRADQINQEDYHLIAADIGPAWF